nr:interleukin-1 receptor-like 2 [Meriones unguiculatus]
MGMVSLLLCGVSFALPLFVTAGKCKDTDMDHEVKPEGQPFAFNCTLATVTGGVVSLKWYRTPNKNPVSDNRHLRIHQDQSWILFLPLAQGDSGIYQCVIRDAHNCYRIAVNLTVFRKPWCDPSTESPINSPDVYRQTLPIGNSGSLNCHLYFPDSCVLDSVKWYKGCEEIKAGKRHVPSGTRLFVNNVTAEDGGSYACSARLTHLGRQFTVRNDIAVQGEEVVSGRRIPNITYPKNNSIEVQPEVTPRAACGSAADSAFSGCPTPDAPGSLLIVDCNVTDSKGNTNLRCWKVNDTLVDHYYRHSRRIQEGIETNVSLKDDIFYTVNITFLEVKMEDYGRPFTCHAGVSAAYIMLKLPAPDFQAYLIGGLMAFLLLVVSILWVYNSFKIDIVLWYRSAFSAAQAPDAPFSHSYSCHHCHQQQNLIFIKIVTAVIIITIITITILMITISTFTIITIIIITAMVIMVVVMPSLWHFFHQYYAIVLDILIAVMEFGELHLYASFYY